MRISVKSLLFTVLTMSLLLAAPLAANAAPFDTSDSVYEVQLWPEGDPGLAFILVSITIPEDTPLPATVRLPFPDEAQISWAGEVRGSDVYEDIPRPADAVEGVGGTSLEITLEETYTAQYDAVYRAMDVDGGRFSVTLDWVQTEPAREVSFAVKVPPAVEDITIDPDPPGSPEESLLGEKLFTLKPMELSPGDSAHISVSYTRPELAGGTKEYPVLLILIIAVVAVVVALLIVLALQSYKRRSQQYEE